MAPKKGKGKGGPVDGVDTTSMSREQLEAFSLRLREELDREREERNFFQLERDKLRTFWEITRQQLEENRAQLRNQDRAQDENEEKHQSEIKTYKQKVKHLLYEHQCNLSNVKVDRMVALKMAQDEYTAMENELLKDKKDQKGKLREQELAHQEIVRQLKMEQSAEISKMREQFSQDALELERKYEARLSTQGEEMGLQQSMELAEVEQRKNRQVVELTKSHEKAFNDMKNYYNEITLNNLALISSLKEQMEELKSSHERMEKQLREVQGENKRLTEPLKQAQSELSNLQRQLASYDHDKITLANTKQRLALVTKELEDLRWENEVLELRFEKVEKERDRLHAEFVGAVLDVQQKSGLKSAMLGKKMSELRGGAVSEGDVPPRAHRRPLPRHRRGCAPVADVTEVWTSPRTLRRQRQPPRHHQPHPQPPPIPVPRPVSQTRTQPDRAPPTPTEGLWVEGGVGVGGSWSGLSSCSCKDEAEDEDEQSALPCAVLEERERERRCSACVLAGVPRCRCPPRLALRRSLRSMQRSLSGRSLRAARSSTPAPKPSPRTPRPHRSCTRRCKKCRRGDKAGPGRDNRWVVSSPELTPKGSPKGSPKVPPSPSDSTSGPSAGPPAGAALGAVVVGSALLGAAVAVGPVVGPPAGLARKRPCLARSTSPLVCVDAGVGPSLRPSPKRSRRSCPSSPSGSPPPSSFVLEVVRGVTPRIPARVVSAPPRRRQRLISAHISVVATSAGGSSLPIRTTPPNATSPRIATPRTKADPTRQIRTPSPSRPKLPNRPNSTLHTRPTGPVRSGASSRTSHSPHNVHRLAPPPMPQVKLSQAQMSLPVVSSHGSSVVPRPRMDQEEGEPLFNVAGNDRDIYMATTASLESLPGGMWVPQPADGSGLPEVVVTASRASNEPSTGHGRSPRDSAASSPFSRPSPWAKAPQRETQMSVLAATSPSGVPSASVLRSPAAPISSTSGSSQPRRPSASPPPRRPSALVSAAMLGTGSMHSKSWARHADCRRPSPVPVQAPPSASVVSSTRRSRVPSPVQSPEQAPHLDRHAQVDRWAPEPSVCTLPLAANASIETVFRGGPPGASTVAVDTHTHMSSFSLLDAPRAATAGLSATSQSQAPSGSYQVRRSFAETSLPPAELFMFPGAEVQRSVSRPVSPRVESRLILDERAPAPPPESDWTTPTAPASLQQPGRNHNEEYSLHGQQIPIITPIFRSPTGGAFYDAEQQWEADGRSGGLAALHEEGSAEGGGTPTLSRHERRPIADSSTKDVSVETSPAVPTTTDTGCDPACELRNLSLGSADLRVSEGTDPGSGPGSGVFRPHVCDASCEARAPSLFSAATSALDFLAAERVEACDASCEARLPSLFSEGGVPGGRPQVCDAACEARAPSLLSAGTVTSDDGGGRRDTLPASTEDSPSFQEQEAPQPQKCDPACDARRVSSTTDGSPRIATESTGVTADFSIITVAEVSSHTNTKLPASGSITKLSEAVTADPRPESQSFASKAEVPRVASDLKLTTADSGLPSLSGSNTKLPTLESHTSLSRVQSGTELPTSESGTRLNTPFSSKRPVFSSETDLPSIRSNTRVPSSLSIAKLTTVESSTMQPKVVSERESPSTAVPSQNAALEHTVSATNLSSPALAAASSEINTEIPATPLYAKQIEREEIVSVASSNRAPSRVVSETKQNEGKERDPAPSPSRVLSRVSNSIPAENQSSSGLPKVSSSICLDEHDSDEDEVRVADGARAQSQPVTQQPRPALVGSEPEFESRIESEALTEPTAVGSAMEEAGLEEEPGHLTEEMSQGVEISAGHEPPPGQMSEMNLEQATEELSHGLAPSRVPSRMSVGTSIGIRVDLCLSETSSSEDDGEARLRRASGLGSERPRQQRRSPRSPRSKSADDLKARRRQQRSDSLERADSRPRAARTSPNRAPAKGSRPQPPKVPATKCSSRIKDWLRGLTHGKWATSARRLSVQTSTSDLSEASPRKSAHPRRPSRKDLFKTDRHAGCRGSASQPASRPASGQSSPSSSRSRLGLAGPGRAGKTQGRQRTSQHSVRFDLETSDSDLGSHHSGLCHMSTSTADGVGRAHSLPQLPRRGGLKRGPRDESVKRSRCRSEARVSGAGAPADEVLLTASTHRKMGADRHLQCYEERTLTLPPLPTRAWPPHSKKKASARPRPAEKKVPAKRTKTKRTAREDSSTHSSESLSSVAGSLPEKAVIWTKPGTTPTAVNSSSVAGSMWLMFPSLVSSRPTPAPAPVSASPAPGPGPKPTAVPAVPTHRPAPEPTAVATASSERNSTAARKEVAGITAKETGASLGAIRKVKMTVDSVTVGRKPVKMEDDVVPSRRATGPTGPAKGTPDSSTSSGSLSPIPQVLSPPSMSAGVHSGAPPSSRLSWRALKDRVTIQEISSDEAVCEEDGGAAAGPVGVATSRLSCLQEETDSDVKLDCRLDCKLSVASGPSDTSFNVADPVVMSRSQLHAWRVVEDTLGYPDVVAQSVRRHRRARRDEDGHPHPRRRVTVADDDADGPSPRGRRWPRSRSRSRSPKVVPGTPAAATAAPGPEPSPGGSRTPKVRFSTVAPASASPSGSAATMPDLGGLRSAVEAHFLQQGARRHSVSLTSMRPCPSATRQAPSPAPGPTPPLKPTRILVSRAKSTASLTGLHDVVRPAPPPPCSDRLGRLLRPKKVMVVELFRKQSKPKEHSSRSSSS